MNINDTVADFLGEAFGSEDGLEPDTAADREGTLFAPFPSQAQVTISAEHKVGITPAAMEVTAPTLRRTDLLQFGD